MKKQWVVIYFDSSDPQFNKCSPSMSKQRAREQFDIMCNKQGCLAKVIKTRRNGKLVRI